MLQVIDSAALVESDDDLHLVLANDNYKQLGILYKDFKDILRDEKTADQLLYWCPNFGVYT